MLLKLSALLPTFVFAEIYIYFLSLGPYSQLQWNVFPVWCFNTIHVSGFYVCGSSRKISN
jgi:hypothetical protein